MPVLRRATFVAAVAGITAAAASPIQDEAREIIARRCLACHSAHLKTAGLDLSSHESLMRASNGGAKLVARVTRGEMPPAKPLPPEEQDTLRKWVEAGAPAWSGVIAARRAGPDWWAFQPLAPGPVRSVDEPVKATLKVNGFELAPPARRETLIRRVSYGLTGLPPTPEQVAEFVADRRLDAYERLVDRLLASPRYGEHWARHWLDVVRYAESEGFERDWLRDHAWPYRDYVIRSFNEDKPYPQFVREQIAGDVIEPSTRDGLVATSMLVLGPTDAVGLTSAVARERNQVRADQLEETVGLVSQTFLGLTVNCARCHDHKFDPIPQLDYYRLKAVFDGVWQPTVGDELRADGRPVFARAEMAAHQAKLDELRRQIDTLAARLGALDRSSAGPGRAAPSLPKPVARWTLDTDARDDVGSLHAVDLAQAARFEDGRLRPAIAKDSSVTVATVPLDFDLREKTIEAWVFAKAKPEKGATLVRIRNRSGFRGAAIDGIHYAGGKKRQWENTSTVRFRTEEVEGVEEDTPAGGRIHMAITYAASGEIRLYRNGQPYGRSYRPDAGTSHGKLQTYGKGDAVVELTSSNGLELEEARIYNSALAAAEIEALFRAAVANSSAPETAERRQLVQELSEAKRAWKDLSAAPPKAFAVEAKPAEPTRFLIRGDVSKPGDVVTPGAVSCVKGIAPDLGLTADAPEAERRRRFADWLTSPANPLAARVMVNRVWHYHFGAGLVESPNDFGFNGGQPSHPALLDFLAAKFLESGGSLKQLHKLILTSGTYRQSSQFNSAAAAKDAGARLLWRFPPQRLPGEAVRDAMLAASGDLNPRMFGPSFRPFQIVKNPGSYHSYDPVDSSAPDLQRRTIYRMNINSGGNPMLDALDCPLPSVKTPKRSSTTTSLQALSLMNNPFVDRMAKTMAARLEAERPDTAGRIERAYALTMGRPPRPEELASASELIGRAGLPAFCWALFNTSEFLYVE